MGCISVGGRKSSRGGNCMSLEHSSMVQNYLNTVCLQIKWHEAHIQVKLELLSHLEELASELIDEGLSEQEAISVAIRRMGDATALGRQLQHTHTPQKNWLLVATVAMLSGMGIVLMYLLGASGSLITTSQVFIKSVIFTGIGAALLLFLYYCDLRRLRDYTAYFYVGTLLLWLAVSIWGTSVNGKVFLSLGPVSIDYISLVPYFLTFALSGMFACRDWSNRQWLVKALLLLVVPVFICAMSNDAYLLLVYMLVFLALMAMAGAAKTIIAGFSILPLGLLLIKTSQEVNGFNLSNIQLANLLGQDNLQVGGAAFHTDYVLRYAIQAFGWLAGSLIIFAEAALLLILVLATLKIKDQFGRMTMGGLTVCLAVQMAWHVLMPLGLISEVSASLPFISFGGSQTIAHLAAIGVILSFYKRKNLANLSGK